jgi:predicted amidohydrolase YtcJ
MTDITVFSTRKIVTMDPACPTATHVAVRGGRVLAVGGREVISAWGDAKLDDSFAGRVLLPGFVEGHSHLLAGGMWRFTYIGYHDRVAPDGTAWPGLADIDAVLGGLRAAQSELPDTRAPLIAWGFDPIFLTAKRLDRHDLDTVSKTRPIVVVHSNFHLMTVNSAVLALAGYSRDSDVTGVQRDADGEPNGELQEFAAMFPIMRRLDIDFGALGRADAAAEAFAAVARRCGVTTATDLLNDLPPAEVEALQAMTGRDDFPLRLVPALSGLARPVEETVAHARFLREHSRDKLRLGAVKLMTDGSIQGFTAQLKWPGYYKGPDHGIWNIAPEQLFETVAALNAAGIQMHIHVNGDAASELALNALEAALTAAPQFDHRHTLQHCQMADRAQFRRMRALGLCVNLFANHLYYFGDQHRDITMGPDRANRMDACASALAEGVPLAIHSDAPVTPMGPLFTAWCAVNRTTASGSVLGPNERISLDQALRSITLGAAYTLKMDGEIGSIEVGKRADFAVLEADPYEVGGEDLKDIGVWGTVLGGRAFPNT